MSSHITAGAVRRQERLQSGMVAGEEPTPPRLHDTSLHSATPLRTHSVAFLRRQPRAGGECLVEGGQGECGLNDRLLDQPIKLTESSAHIDLSASQHGREGAGPRVLQVRGLASPVLRAVSARAAGNRRTSHARC